MKKNTTVKSSRKTPQWAAVGIDLGDRTSLVCGLDEKAQIVTEFKIPTTPEALRAKFRVGDYRVRFHNHGTTVRVLRVRNRREAYR